MELVEVVNIEEWCNYKDLIEEKCPELVESFEETIFRIYDDFELPKKTIGFVVWKDYLYYSDGKTRSFYKYVIVKTKGENVWVFKEEDLKVIYKFKRF